MKRSELTDAVTSRLAAYDVSGAMDVVEIALKRNSKNWRIWSLGASIFEFNGDHREAERWQEKAISLAGPNPAPLMELVELYADTGQFRKTNGALLRLSTILRSGTRRSDKAGRDLEEKVIALRAYVARRHDGPAEEIRVLARGLSRWPQSKVLQSAMRLALSGLPGFRVGRKRPLTGRPGIKAHLGDDRP